MPAFAGPVSQGLDSQRAGRAGGVLILGASGRGKSTLALMLRGLGADLVADDRTYVTRSGDRLRLSAPQAIAGQIEARGIGILQCPTVTGPVALDLVVDLNQPEVARLPPERVWRSDGVAVPCVHGPRAGGADLAFAMAIKLHTLYGRSA